MIDESGFKSMSWFMGYVEDNNDPNGRVRVRAFGVHPPYTTGAVLTDDLPWAHVIRSGKFVSPLDNGDLVVGFFADGRDSQHPFVLGVVNSAKYSTPTPTVLSSLYGAPGIATGTGIPVPVGSAINMNLTTQQRAFLDAIASKESGGAYDILKGGGLIPLTGGHPNIVGGLGSTAAGRYQFTYGTWADISGNAQFSPENQDFYAWKLASQRYAAYTGGGDLDAYLTANGTTPELLTVLSPTWESFEPGIGNQSDIIATYNNSLSGTNTPAGTVSDFTNSYLAPTQDAIDNFGNPALPPQMTGEGIEQTPAIVQAAFRKTDMIANTHSFDEPMSPTIGSVDKTSVWYASYNGSAITVSGKGGADEFVDLTHASGSRVTLDGNGNITIRGMGKVYIGSDGNIEQSATGAALQQYGAGYALQVSGGKVQVFSSGDIELNTGSNFAVNAGGRIILNAGDSVDIAGSRIAGTARVDSIDFVAAGKLAMQSQSTGISLKSAGPLFIQGANLHMKGDSSTSIGSGGSFGIKAAGDVKLKGAFVYLNDTVASNQPDDVPDALAALGANVPPPIVLNVGTVTTPHTALPDINPSMTDETA